MRQTREKNLSHQTAVDEWYRTTFVHGVQQRTCKFFSLALLRLEAITGVDLNANVLHGLSLRAHMSKGFHHFPLNLDRCVNSGIQRLSDVRGVGNIICDKNLVVLCIFVDLDVVKMS